MYLFLSIFISSFELILYYSFAYQTYIKIENSPNKSELDWVANALSYYMPF